MSDEATWKARYERHNQERLEALNCNAWQAREIARLRADLASAREREQRMREALILAERVKYMEGKDDGWIAATMGGCITAALSETSLEPYQRLFPRARAALGEPQ